MCEVEMGEERKGECGKERGGREERERGREGGREGRRGAGRSVGEGLPRRRGWRAILVGPKMAGNHLAKETNRKDRCTVKLGCVQSVMGEIGR
jgi:hypothetical protein